MNLARKIHKSVRIDQDETLQDGRPVTATPLTVGPTAYRTSLLLLHGHTLAFTVWSETHVV